MRRLLVFLSMVAAIVPQTAAGADRVVATVDTATPVSGYRGNVLWSQRDPATGHFALTYSASGAAPRTLPVAQRTVPFDADLGPGPDGLPLAVYSRCRREPAISTPLSQSVVYTDGRGCRLYRLDVTSGREDAARPAARTASDVLPSVWKGRIAFARVLDRRRSFPYLYEGRLGARSARRLPGGPRRGCSSNPKFCGDRLHSRPTALDLRADRLAFAWKYNGTLDGPASEIRLDDTHRLTGRLIDRIRGGGLTSIERVAPNLDGSHLYYARLCRGDQSGCPHRAALVRYGLADRTFGFAPINRGDIWQARTGGTTYVLRDSSFDTACHLVDGPPGPTCRILGTSPSYAPDI